MHNCKRFFAAVVLVFFATAAVAQPAVPATTDNCSDPGSLRNRHWALDAALTKVEVGGKVAISADANLSARLMAIGSFEYYLCRLEGVAHMKIDPAEHDAWINEISAAFDKIEVVTTGREPEKFVENINKARAEFVDPWGSSGEKRQKYRTPKPNGDFRAAFVSAVPKPNLTTALAIKGEVRWVLKQVGLSGEYASYILENGDLVGNLKRVMENSWQDVAAYASGGIDPAIMVGNLVKGAFYAGSQIAKKEANARYKMEDEANAATKAELIVAQKRITELEKEISDLKKN